MRCLLAVLLIGRVILINGAVNYCGAKMCGHSNFHTFCQYKPGPGPFCRGYMEAQLSKEEKTEILNRLNRRRRDAARGSEHWPPAGDMLKLRWVEDLAREAQRWADQCTPPASPEEHDVCRDLYSISVGQCVASIVGEAPGLRPESMVDMWYMQKLIYGGNVTSYILPHHSRFYGDFAQMIWSRTHMVGCARSRFMTDWRGRLRSVERLVCNFAPRGPIPSRPLWTPTYPASLCPLRSHPDTEFPELCAYPETVRELHETLDRVEHTLASPNVVSTPAKVRRELRSKEMDLKKTKNQLNTAPTPVIKKPIENTKKDDQIKSKDKAQMLSMVLRYLPYLKPYEKSIIGETSNDSDVTNFSLFVIVIFSGVINVVIA